MPPSCCSGVENGNNDRGLEEKVVLHVRVKLF